MKVFIRVKSNLSIRVGHEMFGGLFIKTRFILTSHNLALIHPKIHVRTKLFIIFCSNECSCVFCQNKFSRMIFEAELNWWTLVESSPRDVSLFRELHGELFLLGFLLWGVVGGGGGAGCLNGWKGQSARRAGHGLTHGRRWRLKHEIKKDDWERAWKHLASTLRIFQGLI